MAEQSLNKTDSRVHAISDVRAERVSYDPNTGEYSIRYADEAPEVLGGARRRTFAELRSGGFLAARSTTAVSVLDLTDEGITLANEWGVD